MTVTSESPSMRASVVGGTLYVTQLVPEDAGTYTCIGTNIVATVSVTVRVYVACKFTFIEGSMWPTTTVETH